MPITNAALALQVSELLDLWRARELQFKDWLAGVVDGGPFSDGRYPLQSYLGDTFYVYSPAALADTVSGPAGAAAGSANDASDAQAAAEAAQAAAETARDTAATYRDAAQAARDLASNYRDYAANSEALALTYRNKAKDWASKTVDVVVESGLYSALHYATKASETYADLSADLAAATAAAVASATASATASASAASASATAASGSATSAGASATAAAGSATSAGASATAAAASAVLAATFTPSLYATLAGSNVFANALNTFGGEVRIKGSGPFVSFHDAAGTSRVGYVQIADAAGGWIAVEQNKPLEFQTNSIARLVIAASGAINIVSNDIRSNVYYGRTSTAFYFEANNSINTYATWRVGGVVGGYSGIIFPDIANTPTLMIAATATGIYKQGISEWSFYDDWSTSFNVMRPLKDLPTTGAYIGYRDSTNTSGKVTVSTSAPSGTPATGDIWLQRAA